MFSKYYNGIIVILLAGILAVLLFGRENVFSAIWIIALIALGIAAVGVALFFLDAIISFLENAINFWIKLVFSPLFAPIGKWQRINERRAAGEVVNTFSAVASVLWTFLFSVFLAACALAVALGIVVSFLSLVR